MTQCRLSDSVSDSDAEAADSIDFVASLVTRPRRRRRRTSIRGSLAAAPAVNARGVRGCRLRRRHGGSHSCNACVCDGAVAQTSCKESCSNTKRKELRRHVGHDHNVRPSRGCFALVGPASLDECTLASRNRRDLAVANPGHGTAGRAALGALRGAEALLAGLAALESACALGVGRASSTGLSELVLVLVFVLVLCKDGKNGVSRVHCVL